MRIPLTPLLALALALPTSAASAASATPSMRTALVTPAPQVSTPNMTPIAGGLHFTWSRSPLRQVTYTVASSPPGLSCRVVDKAACTIDVTTMGELDVPDPSLIDPWGDAEHPHCSRHHPTSGHPGWPVQCTGSHLLRHRPGHRHQLLRCPLCVTSRHPRSDLLDHVAHPRPA